MLELFPGSNIAVTPTAAWIQTLHVDLVGRLPDRRGVVRRIAGLRGVTHREIARELLQSEEYGRPQISALYRALLDRDGDPDSLAAWVRSLRSGIALQDVIASICDGFEYKANHPDGPALVESLYLRLLRRASDPEGRTAALAALQQRSSTLAVIRGFLTSAEYCCQQVTELYAGLLGRAPESAALAEHSLALMQGTPLQRIVLDLVTSGEYIARTVHRKAELTTLQLDELGGGPAALAPARDRDPDADVLALIGRDTRGALHRLMVRHGRAVYRYCRISLGDAVLADDVHQQVFIEAFRDLPGFAGRSTLRTWLFGIARHRVLDAAKRRRRARAHLDVAAGADLPDPRPSPGEGLDDAQLQTALVTCLATLEEPIRAAVLLRYQQGMTYEEMAGICGEKAGTLQARVTRALRKLRDRLDGQRAQ
ncbi:MAG TPA: sigma-70 family RNA polymerase sigma factor [Kofleriaceae bacterium]|jgi:RNA polymerase sigma-70 factor (ECF subfamily)|nr:sigma-70 family RNA polymerase sigma factor [Kofleriaceae bacterium]